MGVHNEFPHNAPEHANGGLQPPPRFLLWSLVVLFVLTVIGVIAGVMIFRNVLTRGQQEAVVNRLPFMEALLPSLPPTPEGGVIPTLPVATQGGTSPLDLLAPLPTLTVPGEQTPEIMQSTETVGLVPSPTATTATTALPASTPTTAPTATPAMAATPAPVGAQSVTSNLAARPSYALLTGFVHEQQTWNNCGPATVTIALSYYGWRRDQTFAADVLKPNSEDKNVSPGEMVAFVNSETGVNALTRIGGDLEMVKQFIANGFPVIVERGYAPEGYDWIGHYQTIVGYDDAQRVFYIYDSFLGSGEHGEGITESYDAVDSWWRHFGRTFIVIYEPAREGLVAQILGGRVDLVSAAENALAVAQAEARANPADPHAWFNIGTAFTLLGRYTMNAGDDAAARQYYSSAAAAYDEAWAHRVPWRMTWYQFGPFEAYFYAGRYDDVLTLVDINLANTDYVEETYYWQGRVFEARGETQQAVNAYRIVLRRNPNFAPAQEGLNRLNS